MNGVRTILEAGAIVAAGAAIGLVVNLGVIRNAFASPPPLEPARTPSASAGGGSCSGPAGGAMPVELIDVEQMLGQGVYVLDARPPNLFEEGHIPGAISAPAEEARSVVPILEFNVPKDAPVVVYCRGIGCLESANLASCLVDQGYRDVKIFKGGFLDWHAAGLPVESGGGP